MYAASPWMVLLSAPFFILGLLATEIPSNPTWRDAWVVTAIGVAAQLLLALVFVLARLTVLRAETSAPRRAVWALVAYFLAGELRAVFLTVSFEAFGVGDPVPLWVRLLTSAALFPIAFGFSAYALESGRLFRTQRNQLIRSVIEADRGMGQQRAAAEALRESFLASVQSQVATVNSGAVQALEKLEERIGRGEEVREELLELQQQADSGWRQVSHQAWEKAHIQVPRPSGKELLGVVASSSPLSRIAMALGAPFIFSLVAVRALPLGQAAGWSLVWLGVMVGLAWSINALSRAARGFGPVVLVVGIVLLGSAGAAFSFVPGLESGDARGAWVIHLTALGSATFAGVGPALARNQQAVLEGLEKHLDQATVDQLRLESEIHILAQRVGQRLHADRRGHFLAHMTRLRQHLDRGESEEALSELRVIKEALHSAADLSVDDVADDDLAAFLDNWRGLIDIQSNLHTATVPDHLHPLVNTVVMESVNDAVRHGGADWVDIQLEPGADFAELTIVNNGGVPSTTPTAGLGEGALNRIAPGNWERSVDAVGFVRLRVRLVYRDQ